MTPPHAHKRLHTAKIFTRFACLAVAVTLAGCDLVIPPDPPREATKMSPQHFAWQALTYTRDAFIGVERIDCPKIQSTLAGYGICKPKSFPFANGIECPLDFPGKRLQFACITIHDVPAVYASLDLDNNAKNIDFSKIFGPCTTVKAGPAAQLPQRYPTDPGFNACLLDRIAPYSRLAGDNPHKRPAGLFLTLRRPPTPSGNLLPDNVDAPASIIMDSRLLPENERKQSLNDTFLIFNFFHDLGTNFSQLSAGSPPA